MNETPNVTSMVSYIKTLTDGVNYATEQNEIFEFLIALTVITSRLMSNHPEETARLNSAVDEIKKRIGTELMH